MTEQELNAHVTSFHKSVAAAQREADVCGLAVYALTSLGGPHLRGGESVVFVDGDGKQLEDVDRACACSMMAHVLARLEMLKQQYAALFGPAFSTNLQRQVAQRVNRETASGYLPFEQAVADLGQVYAPAIVLGATVAHNTPDGPIEGAAMATLTATVKSFERLAPALAAIQISFERVLAGAAEQTNTPLEEARVLLDAKVEELRRTGDFGEPE